jgi:hypothetical protein
MRVLYALLFKHQSLQKHDISELASYVFSVTESVTLHELSYLVISLSLASSVNVD